MSAAKDFALWFLQQVPAFLLAEPICYFVGLALLLYVARLFRYMIHI